MTLQVCCIADHMRIYPTVYPTTYTYCIRNLAVMQNVAQKDRKHPVKVLCGVFLGNRLHK